MDRTAALAYLQTEFRELADDAKFTSSQYITAYNTAIDMSLRHLGTQETDLATATVDQAHILPFLALLTYYALKRFARLLAIRFDVAVGNGAVDAKRSQAYKMIQEQIKDAEQQLIKLGYDVGGSPSFQVGRINLDFNEPGWTGEYGYADFYGW
ncbi:MAG: hypothetical protein H0U76_07795 [Ktedonobacteraceae bacterium]|nr:hypothetical protein [Ktedonobacteraceae bacterium]